MQAVKELLEGGYLERIILVAVIWGGIILIAAQGRDVPSWLLVAGSTVLGWFFKGSQIAQTNQSLRDKS